MRLLQACVDHLKKKKKQRINIAGQNNKLGDMFIALRSRTETHMNQTTK